MPHKRNPSHVLQLSHRGPRKVARLLERLGKKDIEKLAKGKMLSFFRSERNTKE